MMYSPSFVREPPELHDCLKVSIAIVMGWLIFSSLFCAIGSTTTAAKFTDTGLPLKVITHSFVAGFKFLLLSYSIYGFVAAIKGTKIMIELLYYFTVFICIVGFVLALAITIPCASDKYECDLREYFRELSKVTNPAVDEKGHRHWNNIQEHFKCCGFNEPTQYEKSNQPELVSRVCSRGKDWYMTILVREYTACLTVANYRDHDSRWSLVYDAVSLVAIICLLLVHYFNRNSPELPSYYQPGLLMAGNPVLQQQLALSSRDPTPRQSPVKSPQPPAQFATLVGLVQPSGHSQASDSGQEDCDSPLRRSNNKVQA